MDNPCFFQTFFFSTKCAPFLLKIGNDFNIDDQKGKKTWIDEFSLYKPFEHIWFKSGFEPKNCGIWKCDFNKNCSYICDTRHECIIYMI